MQGHGRDVEIVRTGVALKMVVVMVLLLLLLLLLLVKVLLVEVKLLLLVRAQVKVCGKWRHAVLRCWSPGI